MIFHKFGRGRVGAQKKYMNIYTFWIDLDVPCPFFQKSLAVLGRPGEKFEKYSSTPSPRGVRGWAGVGFGLSTARGGSEIDSMRESTQCASKCAVSALI